MRLYLTETIRGHQAPITALTTLHNRTLISGAGDGSILTHSFDGALPNITMHGHNGAVLALAAFRESHFVVSASADQTLMLWNAETGECVRTLCGHEGAVTAVALADEGRVIISGGADGTVRVWDTLTGEPCGVYAGHLAAVRWLLPLAGAPQVLAGLTSDGVPHSIYLWDYRRGEQVRQFGDPHHPTSCAVLTPEGQLLTRDSGAVLLWDVQQGCVAQQWTLPTASVARALFRSGRHVVLTMEPSQLAVWDLMQGEAAASAALTVNEPTQFMVTLDNRRVVVGSGEGLAYVYRLSSS
ncbi:MAG: WD40 repeat domain-containing protein [Anaerolineae bacterium]